MCRLALLSPCPVVGNDGVCTVFHPEGVLARETRWGKCDFRNMRTPNPLAPKVLVKKKNPIKASKAKG